MVRKTQSLKELITKDIRKEIENLKVDYLPEIFQRAIQYLYRKETRSSYEIESEKPLLDRMERFINILYHAGKQPFLDVMSEKSLTALQNEIVDVRYAQPAFRDFQNYIGQTNYRGEEIYHYVCPPKDMVGSLMKGLSASRFLIHDMLIRDGLAEQGLIIPVSAHMLQNKTECDKALESYSKPLMKRVQCSILENGDLNIDNPDDVGP